MILARARNGAARVATTALVLLLGVAVSGCGSPDIAVPHPTGADATACEAFMKALPGELADQKLASRSSEGPQASYGDPAIVVGCGVGVPPGFAIGAECQVANGVGWYLSPDKAYKDSSLDITVTAAGYRPRVGVFIPARYRDAAVAAVMAELAGAVKRNLTKTEGCV